MKPEKQHLPMMKTVLLWQDAVRLGWWKYRVLQNSHPKLNSRRAREGEGFPWLDRDEGPGDGVDANLDPGREDAGQPAFSLKAISGHL